MKYITDVRLCEKRFKVTLVTPLVKRIVVISNHGIITIIIRLAYASYQRMESIIYREKMASEFFVERIYRTTWNLTHHYINSIIEVSAWLRVWLNRERIDWNWQRVTISQMIFSLMHLVRITSSFVIRWEMVRRSDYIDIEES